MSVSLSLFAGAGQQFFTNNGIPLAGGLLYTYAAGTTTPQASYTSNTGSTAQANPIVLDSAGRVPYEIWLTNGVTYKFVLMDSSSVLIGTYDNIPGQNTFAGDLAFTGNISVGGNLSVTGNETITGNLTVGGTITGGTGRIVQKVTTNFDSIFNTTSGTYVSTGHTASITPTSASNKILVILTSTLGNNTANANSVLSITRGGTSLSGGGTTSFCATLNSTGTIYVNAAVNYLDSPATTSSTTYTVTVAAQSGSTAQYNFAASIASANRAVLTLLEIS